MPSCDIVIIGAGVNGLACAVRLAQAGRQVTVVEAAAEPGGMLALAHLTQGIDPRVMAGMGLARHGLRLRGLATTVLDAGGAHLTVRGSVASGPLASDQSAGWAELQARLGRFAAALAPFRGIAPPRLALGAGNEWWRLARLAFGVRALGRAEMRELLRLILINVADVASDELADDRLRGLLAFDATLGAWLGPRSPNSLILYLNRLAMGDGPFWPEGGMGSVTAAMVASARAAGVTIICNARVAQVMVAHDRAIGVTLADGQVIGGDVVSAISPVVTLRDLVGARQLDAGLYRRATQIRARGAVAHLTLQLSAAPDFRGADPATRLVIAPDVASVEHAWNPVKYGQVPDRPVMEITLPAALQGSGAPVLTALVQCAPHDVPDMDAARSAMLRATMTVLEDHAPGIGAVVTGAQMLLPQDIAARHGSGCWHHAELSVEQMLFLRPLPELAQYATPLPGLWLAGSGSHPGGGVNGAAGWNAAERIIARVPG